MQYFGASLYVPSPLPVAVALMEEAVVGGCGVYVVIVMVTRESYSNVISLVESFFFLLPSLT